MPTGDGQVADAELRQRLVDTPGKVAGRSRVPKRSRVAAVAIIGLVASSSGAHAHVSCWQRPAPESLEEAAIHANNQQLRLARQQETQRRTQPAVLALSDGELRIAFGAGLLVGWGETGYRPELQAVTAVGKSALMAPFAFLGSEGDSRIADLFNCPSGTSWDALAEQASRLVDAHVLARIAQRHAAGARVMIALPGSAARPEHVFDVGAIAASGHPDAQRYIGDILRASVDLARAVDPKAIPFPAGLQVERNWVFRKVGAGQPFLWPPIPNAAAPAAYFLIHNGVLFADESDEFVTTERAARAERVQRLAVGLAPAFDLQMRASAEKSRFQFASLRPRLNLVAQDVFDATYLRDVFHFAYRQGRMSKEWKPSLPTLGRSGVR